MRAAVKRYGRLTAATPSAAWNYSGMSEAQRFRDRARDCRVLAKSARNEADAALLEEIADDLDAEADKIDAEERNPDQ